ncbi:MAG: hypothetical protein M3308_07335 [Actinomycetota bacterium]|nr:hypothetical protein [Actinomycetota bacterium]
MSITAAALVLAWLCLILLAFALAGVLQQVRGVQAELASLQAPGRGVLVGRRVPALSTGTVSMILMIDPGCSRCKPIFEEFSSVAAKQRSWHCCALSFRRVEHWPSSAAVPWRIDGELYADLDVPWSPALLVVDPDGKILRAAPLRSPEDLRLQIEQVDARLSGGPTSPPPPHATAGS